MKKGITRIPYEAMFFTVLITKSTIDLLHRCSYGTLTYMLRNFSDSLFNIIIPLKILQSNAT